MFMLSVRLSKKRIFLGLAALLLVAGLGVAGFQILNTGTMTLAPTPVSEKAPKAKKVTLKTAEERLAFIQSFGWEVAPEPVEVLEVIIPKEFDAVYQEYNDVQKKQGYDLEKYAGKRAKRYSYVVTNYPGAEGEVRFNLLLSGDKVIGGDVCSMEQEGFLHGFALEQ